MPWLPEAQADGRAEGSPPGSPARLQPTLASAMHPLRLGSRSAITIVFESSLSLKGTNEGERGNPQVIQTSHG